MSEAEKGITRRTGLQGSLAVGLAAALPVPAAPQPSPSPSSSLSPAVNAVIDAAKTGEPISKFIYGAFSEHIQGFIYGALWAEVLSDRKFYYAVDDQNPSARKWRPLAATETVKMDSTAPYVGEHSPSVALSTSQRRGIWQDGLALAEQEYA